MARLRASFTSRSRSRSALEYRPYRRSRQTAETRRPDGRARTPGPHLPPWVGPHPAHLRIPVAKAPMVALTYDSAPYRSRPLLVPQRWFSLLNRPLQAVSAGKLSESGLERPHRRPISSTSRPAGAGWLSLSTAHPCCGLVRVPNSASFGSCPAGFGSAGSGRALNMRRGHRFRKNAFCAEWPVSNSSRRW